MLKRLIVCSSVLTMVIPITATMADNVDMSAEQRAANIKAYNERKAKGLVDTPRGGRGAQKQQKPQGRNVQQTQRDGQRCDEAARNAQATATGTAVLSSVIGLLPFGGSASGVANIAANVGASAAGEIARQQSATKMQEECM